MNQFAGLLSRCVGDDA